MTLATTLTEQRKQTAIDVIARTALRLFSRDGFEATSVESIAAEAGCSPRTFYRYFGTKEDVMFHDLPAVLEQLAADLDAHLAVGVEPWAAVTEALVSFTSRFETDELFPTERMNLWLKEPALRTRYTQYVHKGEHVIASCLCRHRGTTLEQDDLAQLMAVAATGATRVTLLTHRRTHRPRKLAEHLREALGALGQGLAEESVPLRRASAA
jgi:AcrR family transcriptional regulator